MWCPGTLFSERLQTQRTNVWETEHLDTVNNHLRGSSESPDPHLATQEHTNNLVTAHFLFTRRVARLVPRASEINKWSDCKAIKSNIVRPWDHGAVWINDINKLKNICFLRPQKETLRANCSCSIFKGVIYLGLCFDATVAYLWMRKWGKRIKTANITQRSWNFVLQNSRLL